MSGPPDVTSEHVALVTRISRSLGRTPLGEHVGADELESEAMVVLWDLALTWDESVGVPFSAYLATRTRHRLVDWMRREVGRGARRDFNATIVSYDDPLPGTDVHAHPSPGPEAQILAREELLEAVAATIALCSPRQATAVLWPVFCDDDGFAAVADRWGMERNTVHVHRRAGRLRIAHLRP